MANALAEAFKGAPSRADMDANGNAVFKDLFESARNRFDVLKLGQQIASSIAGVSSEAMPAADFSDLLKGKPTGPALG